jgi:LacI family transcriptional regulator
MPAGPFDSTRGRAKLGDVATRAGVSTGTVSNVLNHPDKVAPETLERVTRAIRDLGFTRNGAASTLASGTSRAIGLVVVDLMNSLFVDMARGAQRAAHASGFDLQLSDCDNDVDQQDSHLAFLAAANVAGVLLAPLTDPDEAVFRLRAQGRPVIMLNYSPSADDFCRVVIDNERVGYLAAEHMISLGRRRIAFVGGHHEVQPVRQRLDGVHRAVDAAGGIELREINTVDLNPPSGIAVARGILASPREEWPDAIIAVTDLLAMAMISEFVAAEVRVPGDIAVMGCDHNSMAWGGAMPLTSVTMRGQEMGRRGVELLRREIAEPAARHRHETVVLEPELLVRESTAGRTSLPVTG